MSKLFASTRVSDVFLIPRSQCFILIYLFIYFIHLYTLPLPPGRENISKCQRQLLNSNRAFWRLENSLTHPAFIRDPGPEIELSSARRLLVLVSQKKKVSYGNIFYCVEEPRMFQPMNWAVSYAALYPLYPFQSCSVSFLLFLHALLLLVIPASFTSVLSLHLSVGSGSHCSCKHIYCVNIAVAKQLKTVTGACQQPARSLVH